MTLHLSAIHPAVMARAALHGLCQRIPDGAAIERTDKEGRIIPDAERDAEKFRRMAALVAHYESGAPEWGLRGDGAGAEAGITERALGDVFGERYAAVVAKLTADGTRDEKQARALMVKTAEVQQRLGELRAERAKAGGVSADELLSGLGE